MSYDAEDLEDSRKIPIVRPEEAYPAQEEDIHDSRIIRTKDIADAIKKAEAAKEEPSNGRSLCQIAKDTAIGTSLVAISAASTYGVLELNKWYIAKNGIGPPGPAALYLFTALFAVMLALAPGVAGIAKIFNKDLEEKLKPS